jgi:phosphocarrier protein HPr
VRGIDNPRTAGRGTMEERPYAPTPLPGSGVGIRARGCEMATREVTVVNQLGLHARAAARFVHLATRFDSHIRVTRNTKVMDGKSIMGILLLAAAHGTALTITAEGPDEEAAVAALADLVSSGFGEDSWSA